MKNLGFILLLACGILLCGCGDDDNPTESPPPIEPGIPAGLTATGTYGNIDLLWNACSGSNLQGYNVYRSPDGAAFTKLTPNPITDTTYNDNNVDDGVYYHYKITAVGTDETGYSDTVKQMHGIRLIAAYPAGCELAHGDQDIYVVENTTVIDGGNLYIDEQVELYLLDNAVIDMEDSCFIDCYGLLRVEASVANYATMTAHKTGGLNPGDGFGLRFFNTTVDYNAGTGAGTLIRNCNVINLRNMSIGNAHAIHIEDCSPRFYNAKFSSNINTGTAYAEIRSSSAPIIEHCQFDYIVLKIRADLRSTTATIAYNICRDGYYSLYFYGQNNVVVDPGQIANNDFDGNTNGLYCSGVDTGGEDIPLQNNYWLGGIPTVAGSITASVNFDPVLATPPVGAGPTW